MIAFLIASAVAQGPVCTLPFRTVPTPLDAKAIALRVSAAAPDGPGSEAPYDMKVDYIESRDVWLAYEVPSGHRGMLGGDGLQMFISACDGAVSDVRRQR